MFTKFAVIIISNHIIMPFTPDGSVSKEVACNARKLGSVPGLGRSLEEENDNPF